MPIKQGNPVNNVSTPTLRSKTPFKIPFGHKSTQRFSEIDLIFSMDTVPNDDIMLAQRSVLHTYTLKAPMLNKLTKHTAYYSVPKSAILPHTWSKLFVNPKKGDDVVPEDVNAIFPTNMFLSWATNVANFFYSVSPAGATFLNLLRFLTLYVYMFGPDSLSLKARTPIFKLSSNYTAANSDFKFESSVGSGEIMFNIQQILSGVSISGDGDGVAILYMNGDPSTRQEFNLNTYIGDRGFAAFIDCIMHYDVDISVSGSGVTTALFQSLIKTVFNVTADVPVQTMPYRNFVSCDVNIQRLCAYQLAMASFATRDTVDDVYTSELYRQNMESLYLSVIGNVLTFKWNGVSIIYDWCSNAVMKSLCQNGYQSEKKIESSLFYFANLFYPRVSLRYADMFSSARTEPFAVGDTDIDVSANTVKVTDVVFNILKEKYLNLVNNVENTVARYSQAVFGVTPSNLPPEPYKLGEFSYDLKSNINVNLADDQGKQENNLTGMYNGQAFPNHHFSQDEIIIGVAWYVMELPYILNSSPFAYKSGRFDYFLPQLQNIGSVSVDKGTTAINGKGDIFGYLPNDYEYKQEYSDAVGAFIGDALPGWCRSRLLAGVDSEISPFFIRPSVSEMDVFYKSLTGTGFNYFHFICSDQFIVYSNRPMEYTPTVLGNL